MNNTLLVKINLFYTLTRAYSLPISVMSWFIPFIFAAFKGGNIFYGFVSLVAIIILHLSVNLFDDIVDYSRELFDIKRAKKTDFNFQKGKCICLIQNKITLKQALFLDFIMFFIVLCTGIFFLHILGSKLLFIIIPSAVLCLLYPVLGCLGFGEVIVALIFAPLLYSGVYFVMKGIFSFEILYLSVSTGLLSVAVLINHSILDYKYDTTNRKITLCRICRSEKKHLCFYQLSFLVLILTFYIG